MYPEDRSQSGAFNAHSVHGPARNDVHLQRDVHIHLHLGEDNEENRHALEQLAGKLKDILHRSPKQDAEAIIELGSIGAKSSCRK